MSVHLIQNLEDWQAQQAAWEEIYQANGNHTPYQSFEWLTRNGGQI